MVLLVDEQRIIPQQTKNELYPSNYNYSQKINHEYTLINNTLTGALDIINTGVWDLIKERKFTGISSDILSKLSKRGYFYSSLKKEDTILKELCSNYIKKAFQKPRRIVFCPSYQCNLKCIYCFQEDLPHNPHKFMSRDILYDSIKAARKISEEKSGKIDSIELFGGEPLLLKNKTLLEEIFKFAEEKNASITIVTNGVMVKNLLDILLPVKDKIDMLQITIDGPGYIHDGRRKFASGRGSFNKISESIDILLKNNINTCIRVNMDGSNIDYLPQFYNYIKKKKWVSSPNLKIKPALVTDHSTLEYNNIIIPEEILLEKLISIYDSYPELEEEFGFYAFKPLRHLIDILNGAPNVSPKFFNCESNILEMVIFCPDGYMYACGESIGKPEYAIGKFSPGLQFYPDKKKIWTERSILNIDKCKNCNFAPLCGGGCAYSSLLVYGDSNHPVCERFRKVLDTFIDLRGEKIFSEYLKEQKVPEF